MNRMMEDEDCRIRNSMDIRLDLNGNAGVVNGKNTGQSRKKKEEEEEEEEEEEDGDNDENGNKDLDITGAKKSRSKWDPKPGGGLPGLDFSYGNSVTPQ